MEVERDIVGVWLAFLRCSFDLSPLQKGCRLYILYFGILTSRSCFEWLKVALRFLLPHSPKWPQYICKGLIINANDSKIILPGTETFSTRFPVHIQYSPTSHFHEMWVNQNIKHILCSSQKRRVVFFFCMVINHLFTQCVWHFCCN